MSSATLNRKKLKAKKVLLIIDDAISESTFINSPSFLKIFIQGLHTSVWRALRSLLDCLVGRHYGISVMVMSQSYMKVWVSVRNCSVV